jgi:hypothetical protein
MEVIGQLPHGLLYHWGKSPFYPLDRRVSAGIDVIAKRKFSAPRQIEPQSSSQ